MWKYLRNWIGIDRIRVAAQTGRLGRLVVGDQLIWDDTILEVKDRTVLIESENESRVLLSLESIFEPLKIRYELSLTATSTPRARLLGKLRIIDNPLACAEMDVTDDDLVLLPSKKSL